MPAGAPLGPGLSRIEVLPGSAGPVCWKGRITLRASLSGTFLQILPDLVAPLKGHSVFISAPQLSSDAVSALRKVWVLIKLQALIYNILPSTTAVPLSYGIGSRQLSANEQFFVGAQTVVSLLQITQIKQGVSFL